MRVRSHACRVVVLASALTMLSGCGGSEENAADIPATPESATLSATPEPVQLTADDVEHFLAAATEIKALGLNLQSDQGNSPSDLTATIAAWGANRDVMGILRKHEFDLTRFHRVTYSVMMAAAADGVSKQDGEMAEARKKLEAMKSQMTPGMYESMMKAQNDADSMVKQIMNQPPGNVELVRRYRDRIEALGRG